MKGGCLRLIGLLAVTVAGEEKEEEKRKRRTEDHVDKQVCFDPVCATYALRWCWRVAVNLSKIGISHV